MQPRTVAAGVVVAAFALGAASCGGGDSGSGSRREGDASRTVEVAMVDVDFEPATLRVRKGEEVRFVFTNDGDVRHEAYFGTPAEQADHGKEMAGAGNESDGHGGP